MQLESVGAGIFEQLRVGNPAAGGAAVERRDYRNADRTFDAAQMLEVLVRPQGHLGFRLEGAGFAEGIAVSFDVEEGVHLLARNFFFVERTEHQHGGAGVFERLDGVEIIARAVRRRRPVDGAVASQSTWC